MVELGVKRGSLEYKLFIRRKLKGILWAAVTPYFLKRAIEDRAAERRLKEEADKTNDVRKELK
jgi:hypothetical protein